VDVVGPLPAKASVLTDVVGVISVKPSDPKVAKALLDYLASPEATAVYKTTGLQPAHLPLRLGSSRLECSPAFDRLQPAH